MSLFIFSEIDQEELEKKKAKYAEKMKNKVGLVRKQAEEKMAILRGEELLKAQEMAAKYNGETPKLRVSASLGNTDAMISCINEEYILQIQLSCML
ncbi:hypothetical protein QQ045_021272 [Rhodiola kirilowii]